MCEETVLIAPQASTRASKVGCIALVAVLVCTSPPMQVHFAVSVPGASSRTKGAATSALIAGAALQALGKGVVELQKGTAWVVFQENTSGLIRHVKAVRLASSRAL